MLRIHSQLHLRRVLVKSEYLARYVQARKTPWASRRYAGHDLGSIGFDGEHDVAEFIELHWNLRRASPGLDNRTPAVIGGIQVELVMNEVQLEVDRPEVPHA